MKANITPQTLAEMNETGLTPSLPKLVKYVVSHSSGEIDTQSFNHWRNVVNYLSDDDQVKTIAYHDYMQHLEGSFNEENLTEWIEMYLNEFAAQAGYTIGEVK